MIQRGSIRKRGSSFTAYYFTREPDGRRKQRSKGGFRTRRDAQAFLNDTLGALAGGTFVPPTKRTFGQYINDEWLPSLEALVTNGKLRPTTVSSYKAMMKLHIVPRIGGILLADLSAPNLNRLYADLLESGRKKGKGDGLSPTSVHMCHVIIGRALKDAVKWGRVGRNVAQMADPPKVKNAEKVIWTPEQLRAFLDGTRGDRLGAMWMLFATTGMRRGEVVGLHWEDVDLEREELRVRRTRVIVDGYHIIESTPKTAKGERVIALDSATVAALRRHRVMQAQERLAWGEAYQDTGLVFTREDGSGVAPDRVGEMLDVWVKKLQLPRVTAHGLRHSYATALADAGVSIDVVSKRLGHSSVAITADLYRHRTDESDRNAAALGAARIVGGAGS